FATELPLAGNARRVASVLQQIGKRRRLRIEQAKLDIVASVRHSRHQLRARWRAHWLNLATIESDTGRSELVEVRCLVRRTAVAAERFIAEVVGHDQNDVRLFRVGGRGTTNQEGESKQGGERVSEHWSA